MRSTLRITPGREFLRHHLALMIDLQQRRKHQPVGLRNQRADVGGKLEGQHGHGAVGEVDAGAAQAGLVVDGRSRAHVVADVGDVHLERVVAVGQAVHPYGVVEIAGGFAVDRHDVHARGNRGGRRARASVMVAGMVCACSTTSGGNWCGR